MLNVCRKGHCEVSYSAKECPVCMSIGKYGKEANSKIVSLEKAVNSYSKEASRWFKKYKDLRKKYNESKGLA